MPHKDPEVRKAYQKAYQRQWIAQRRADFFADKICVRCGSSEGLELDHIDPSTKISNNIWSWSQVRREAEIAKCQILCADCHTEKTVENWEHAHGETHGWAKLTEEQMIEALEDYATGRFTFARLGNRYGVHRDTFRHAWKGESVDSP